jgi:16S rRNA (cytosine967-C5)-methyltransferase
MKNPRAIATQIITAVSDEHIHLESAFDKYLSANVADTQAFIKALCFGVLREYYRLEFILNLLLERPLKKKEILVKNLLLAGLYEIMSMQTPQHACVSETVETVTVLKKQWARGLVNAILRKSIRETKQIQSAVEKTEVAKFAHPAWLIDLIKSDWPEHYSAILQANNQPGPLSLRVNQHKLDCQLFIDNLEEAGITATQIPYTQHGVLCESAMDVTLLPGYEDGHFSVQDAAPQLAAELLAPQKGERILDACAAPGGKTTHLLELQPDIELLALDKSKKRLARIQQNLSRLQLNAKVIEGDARQPQEWWDKQPFDRILLDAPCSATGVIRRHPDIKLLRRPDDIPVLVKTQQEMLLALWPLLKPGGMLLYSTCSILKQENEQQIQRLSPRLAHCRVHAFDADWGIATDLGRQILPGQSAMDGFYYSILYKDKQTI